MNREEMIEGVHRLLQSKRSKRENLSLRKMAEIAVDKVMGVESSEDMLKDRIDALQAATSTGALWSDKRHTLEVMLSELREDLSKLKREAEVGK